MTRLTNCHVASLLLTFGCIVVVVSAKTYYATPTHGTKCPGTPCMTLLEYANETSSYFASNTTLILLPGNHSLDNKLLISNIQVLEIHGFVSENPVFVMCQRSAIFNAENITRVYVSNIHTIGCGYNRAFMVEEFRLENSSIRESFGSGSGLVLDEVANATIVSCDFILNGGSELVVPNNGRKVFLGGAMYVLDSKVSIVNCNFRNNTAADYGISLDNDWQEGGAIFASNSVLYIKACLFQSNAVDHECTLCIIQPDIQRGGAISALNCTCVVDNCTFVFNAANVGGAIYADQDSFIVIGNNSNFTKNGAVLTGGAMAINRTYIEINGGEFQHNFAAGRSVGGAISLYEVEPNSIINGSSFSFNKVVNSNPFGLEDPIGGALYIDRCSGITFQHCAFTNNTTPLGAAMYVSFSDNITIKDCRYSYNNVDGVAVGGANYVVFGELSSFSFERVTFSNNVGMTMLLSESSANITDSTFDSNVQNSNDVIDYVITMKDTDMLLRETLFINNDINGVLGLANHSYVTAENTNFTGNMINDDYGNGLSVVAVGQDTYLTASGCNFTNNFAPTGGVISILNSTTDLRDNFFFNNTVNLTGVVDCYGQDAMNPVQITLTNTDFVHNSGGVVTAFACTIQSSGYLNIVNNTEHYRYGVVKLRQQGAMTFSGNSTFTGNQGSCVFVFDSNVTFNGHTIFSDNSIDIGDHTYQSGGGITVIQGTIKVNGNVSLTRSTAQYGGAAYIKESQLYVTGTLTISKNTAMSSGGGIYAYQSQLSFRGHGVIQGNNGTQRGGGIHAIGTTIVLLKGKIQFIDNSATLGGGVYLEQNSKIYINKDSIEMEDCSFVPKPSPVVCNSDTSTWLRIDFTHNSAQLGGAVYVNDENSGSCKSTYNSSNAAASECFIQTLVQYATVSKIYVFLSNPVNVHFTHNSATHTGPDIYGGLLDRCTVDEYSEQYLLHKSKVNSISYIFNITNIKRNRKTISSNASRVCFCKDDQPDCSYRPSLMPVNRGPSKFEVSLVAVDQANHSIPATIHSSLHSQRGGLGEGQASQNTSHTCTNLVYSIVSPFDKERVLVYPEGPCKDVGISQNYFEVKFQPCKCPIGFKIPFNAQNCTCDCDPEIEPYVEKCLEPSHSVLKDSNTWIGYFNDSSDYLNDSNDKHFIIHPHCPFDYCLSTKSVSINFNVPDGADTQCAFNRTSMLCGACRDGLSLTLGTSQCRTCTNSWLALLVVFALAGIALVAFLLVLNLTVFVGTINGLIFYANIVAANSTIFLPTQKTNILTVFISWLNLDLGIETCFYNGMDGYAKTWLQILFPAYIIFLVVTIIIVSDYSRKFAKILIGKNPVATLATLVLLSYTKLIRVIIAALSFTTIDYPDGSAETVWLFDANVPYLRGKHIALFVAALLIIIAGLSYTLLLFCWQWILKMPRMKWILHNEKFKDFMETYHGPHQMSSIEHRYWTGLLLFIRIILYIISAVNVNGDPAVNLLCINSVMIGLLAWQQFTTRYWRKPIYKSWLLDILESSFFFNLIVFSTATLYTIQAQTTTNGAKQRQFAVAMVSTSVVFVTFVFIILYHIDEFLLKSRVEKLMKKCFERFNKEDDSETPLPRRKSIQVLDDAPQENLVQSQRMMPVDEIDGRPPKDNDKPMASYHEELHYSGGESKENSPLLSHSHRNKKYH